MSPCARSSLTVSASSQWIEPIKQQHANLHGTAVAILGTHTLVRRRSAEEVAHFFSCMHVLHAARGTAIPPFGVLDLTSFV